MIAISDEEKSKIREKLVAYKEKIYNDYKILDDRLIAIKNMFNTFVPQLEEKYLTPEELKSNIFLPDEIRIIFYEIFPEHGLNMAKEAERLASELSKSKRLLPNVALSLRHQD